MRAYSKVRAWQAADRRKPPLITCRVCGHQHYSASVCPVCKVASPSFAVIKPAGAVKNAE